MPTLVYRKRGRPNAFVFGAQETPITVGRNPSCVIVVESVGVSRHHAELRTPDDGTTWKIVDQGSANGTWVNGERVTEAVLRDKDSIVCGDFAMEFRRGPGTGRFQLTGPESTRRTMDSGNSPAVERMESDTSLLRMRVAAEASVDLASPRGVVHEESVEVSPELVVLQRRVAALEARNASLLDEVMLLRGMLIESPTNDDTVDEFKDVPTGLRPQTKPSAALSPSRFDNAMKRLPSDIALMLRSAVDLDIERNAMLERFIEAVVERLDRSGKP